MSYLVSYKTEKILIPGDIILGTPSCTITDFYDYMSSLYLLKSLNIDKILVPH